MLLSCLGVLIAVLACLAWWRAGRSLSPSFDFAALSSSEDAGGGAIANDTREEPGRAPIDVNAFDRQLWFTPPPPPARKKSARSAAARTAPRVQLQLVSVTSEKDGRTAALYDPARDRLHLVREGDRIHDQSVDRVELDRVRVSVRGQQVEIKMKRADS